MRTTLVPDVESGSALIANKMRTFGVTLSLLVDDAGKVHVHRLTAAGDVVIHATTIGAPISGITTDTPVHFTENSHTDHTDSVYRAYFQAEELANQLRSAVRFKREPKARKFRLLDGRSIDFDKVFASLQTQPQEERQ